MLPLYFFTTKIAEGKGPVQRAYGVVSIDVEFHILYNGVVVLSISEEDTVVQQSRCRGLCDRGR